MQGSMRSSGRIVLEGRRGRLRMVAAVATVALVPALAGCQGSEPANASSGGPAGATASSMPTPTASAARLALTPEKGSKRVGLDAQIGVELTDGTLQELSVRTSDGSAVKGELSSDGTSWVPSVPLAPATTYAVRARAVDQQGLVRKAATRFKTVTPKKVVQTSISPLSGSTVGVGHPLVVMLHTDVDDDKKAAVERGLQVTGSKPLDGVWSWVDDDELHYRTKDWFPADSEVTLDVRLAGLELTDGIWATAETDRTVEYSIGASMISVVDVKKHTMVVRRNGKVWDTIPITTGKPGFLTRNGIKVISEKYEMKTMDAATTGINPGDPEYYRLEVPYAMRVTNSGEFVHAAPWSAGSQGEANVSHGCVGMSLADAKRFFEATNVGDVVRVKGSPRELDPGNGWTDWNVSWAEWKQGSATA